MEDLIRILFWKAEPQTILIVAACYATITWVALRRFNTLLVGEAREISRIPEQTKAWTTRIRFWLSALAYLTALLFVFRWSLYAPDFIQFLWHTFVPNVATLGSSSSGIPETGVTEAPQNSFLVGSGFPVLVLIVGVALMQLPRNRPVEHEIRAFLQRLGAIPQNVRRKTELIKDSDIDITESLSPKVRLKLDVETLPRKIYASEENARNGDQLLLKATYYDAIFLRWSDFEKGSDFFDFYRQNKAAFAELTRDLNAGYEKYQDYLRQSKVLDKESSKALGQKAESLIDELSKLLKRQRVLLACALLSCASNDKRRLEALNEWGIRPDPTHNCLVNRAEALTALKNDITLTLLVFFLVGYPVLMLLLFSFGWRPHDDPFYRVALIWPTMAVGVAAAAIYPALTDRPHLSFSERASRHIQVRAHDVLPDLPWVDYAKSAALAVVLGPIALLLVDLIDIGNWNHFLGHLRTFWVYGLVSGLVCLVLSIMLDVTREQRRWVPAAEGLVVGVLTSLVAVLAYLLQSSVLSNTPDKSQLVAVVAITIVLGFVIGYFIPSGYRRYVRPLGGVESDEEEALLHELNHWVTQHGLPEGHLMHELSDSDTGRPIGLLDLAWPEGLQKGPRAPVAVLINEGPHLLSIAQRFGFRYFTTVDDFKRYVANEVLAERPPNDLSGVKGSEQPAARGEEADPTDLAVH